MLIGEYIHSLDDKNRVALPAKFRQEMGKVIIIAPGLDNCLALFTLKEWQKMSDKLSESSMLQSDNRSFSRRMFGQAVEVTTDTLGRILIPDFLKDRAKLKSRVILIGVRNRVEIWNDRAWAEYKEVVEKQADALAEKLGSGGVL